MEDILMLYYEINSIYLELYKLELNKNNDCSVFIELVNLLKEKIDEEKVLIKELIDDNEDIYACLYDLDKEVDTPFAKRVSDYVRFNNDLNIELESDEDKDMTNYTKLYAICSRNVFLIYMSFLQEYIDLDDDLREKLLNFKYCNSFINHDVENSLINNNFIVGRENYVNLYFVGRLLKINNDDVDKIIIDCLRDTVVITVKQLLLISDSDYNDSNKCAISVNNQCMLKAGLSIFSDSEYNKFIFEVNNIINANVTDKNIISGRIIYDIFNDRIKNKSRVKKISLGLRGVED